MHLFYQISRNFYNGRNAINNFNRLSLEQSTGKLAPAAIYIFYQGPSQIVCMDRYKIVKSRLRLPAREMAHKNV